MLLFVVVLPFEPSIFKCDNFTDETANLSVKTSQFVSLNSISFPPPNDNNTLKSRRRHVNTFVRIVNCVKPTGKGEGEIDVITESEFNPPMLEIVQFSLSLLVENKTVNDGENLRYGIYLQHFSYKWNRNPYADPVGNVLEIISLEKLQRVRKTGGIRTPECSYSKVIETGKSKVIKYVIILPSAPVST